MQSFEETARSFLAPLLPEEVLIEEARRRLSERHPNAPIEWAIKYARSNTDRATKGIGGPLKPFIRRAVLNSQLEDSENYLTSISQFLELENPVDTEAPRD